MTRTKRRPLSRDMLLPLAAEKARAISLEYHLALSVLAAGDGDVDQAAKLMQVMMHGHVMAGSADARAFEAARSALDDIGLRAEASGAWLVTDDQL